MLIIKDKNVRFLTSHSFSSMFRDIQRETLCFIVLVCLDVLTCPIENYFEPGQLAAYRYMRTNGIKINHNNAFVYVYVAFYMLFNLC